MTRSCLAGWERLGYNGTDVAMYLNTTRWIADHPNTALDLRIEHGNEYRCDLARGLRASQKCTRSDQAVSHF